MKKSVIFISRAALIGALYFVLTISLPALSYGPLQFRLSEALVLIAVIFPEAIPGLTVGCVLANFFFSPYGIYDMVFGGLATLLGAVGTYLLRKNIPLASLPPIIFNTLLVPVIFIINDASTVYYVAMFEILASEIVTVGIIGIPLTYGLRKAFHKAGLLMKKKSQTEDEDDVLTDTTADCVNIDKNDDDNSSAHINGKTYTPTELWDRFLAGNNLSGCSYDSWAFGIEPDLLAHLVATGQKTATSSALPLYEIAGEPIPEVDDEYSIILDSKGNAVCIIKTTKVEIVPFNKITEMHAQKEGEGDKSLDYWKKVHQDFFTNEMKNAGLEFTPNMKVVFEEFEVVFKP